VTRGDIPIELVDSWFTGKTLKRVVLSLLPVIAWIRARLNPVQHN